MISILSQTAAEYVDHIHARLGKGREHALLLYREWFRHGTALGNSPAFNNAQELLEAMRALTDFAILSIVQRLKEGEVEKILLTTHDGLSLEMVLIPMPAGNTLCISSQVGCKRGCAFCETGKMGLLRSLTAAEIVGQFFLARHALGFSIRNIVFMGMGEPLDNFEEVVQAIRILTDMDGVGLGGKRITLSTVGLPDQIDRLADVAPCHLALSLHAATDSVRSRLMPVNREHDLAKLRRALERYASKTGRKIFIEYILIDGVTDRPSDAEALSAYLAGLPVSINLIPYNPQRIAPFRRPSPAAIDSFAERLRMDNYRVFIRGTKGDAILAACGQLRTLREKTRGAYAKIHCEM